MKQPTLTGQHHIASTIDINATQEQVWAVLKDFANVYQWAPGVKESHALGSLAESVGAGRHCVLEEFGKVDEYVTQWYDGKGFVYDVTPLGPLNKSFSCWWLESPSANVTRLTTTFAYDIRFGLFGKAMHKLVMQSKLKKAFPEVLEAIKTHIEDKLINKKAA